jgi:hypothetical protein
VKVFKQKGTTHKWVWTEANDGSLSIRAGCFTGTLPDLIERIGTNKAVERFDLIKEALRALSRKENIRLVGYGRGSGDGYGHGNGNGDGYGNGNGFGYDGGYSYSYSGGCEYGGLTYSVTI